MVYFVMGEAIYTLNLKETFKHSIKTWYFTTYISTAHRRKSTYKLSSIFKQRLVKYDFKIKTLIISENQSIIQTLKSE